MLLAWNIGQIFMKFRIGGFLQKKSVSQISCG